MPRYTETDLAAAARSPFGVIMLVIPILSILILFAAYGFLVFRGLEGRGSDGPLATMTFRTCPEARPVIATRVEQMGLTEVVYTDRADGFVLDARLSSTPGAAESIPHTLATVGRLEIRSDQDEVLFTNDDVASATVILGIRAQPRTLIQLTESATDALAEHMVNHSEGHITYWVDGVMERERSNLPPEPQGQIELEKWDIPPVESVAYAAHFGVVLDSGPLPCSADVEVVLDEPAPVAPE